MTLRPPATIAGRRAEPLRGIDVLRRRIRVVGEVEILGGALRDAPARQQPDLGRDEIVGLTSPTVALARLVRR